jgi:Na+/melibiose symporter-like transporter
VPNVEQTASSLKAIEFGIVWLPTVCFVLAVIPVFFYGRFERLEPQIHAELDRRRAQAVHKRD